MLNKARAAHIEYQTLLLAYTHIKAYEQRRAAGRLP
jgi:2-dehydropantoate 2-reductase